MIEDALRALPRKGRINVYLDLFAALVVMDAMVNGLGSFELNPFFVFGLIVLLGIEFFGFLLTSLKIKAITRSEQK